MAKLKVFQASVGFFETVVAAPSKKAALAAWGSHQDLFASGAATAAEDPVAVKAALASPGVVLRRAAGSKGAFSEAGDLSGLTLPDPPKGKAQSKDKAAKGKRSPPPPADRTALTAAEAALAGGKARYAKARADIDARRKALESEAAALGAAYDTDRKALEEARAKAAKAYRRAGG